MQDEQIVALYLKRDETAITATERKYQRYLLAIAYNILEDREDSMESVNDTYLAAWNSIPPHQPSMLSTYLGKLTRRISIDLFRKKHRQKRVASEYTLSLSELGECVADHHSVDERLQIQLLVAALNRFLRSLPEKDRNLFISRYYFMDPLKKSAGYCGITEGTAKRRLFRIREWLRRFLQEEGFEL